MHLPDEDKVENVCGILIVEKESEKEALKSSNAMKECPRLIAVGTNGNTYYCVFIVPKDKTWWLEIPEAKPEILGAKSVKMYITEELVYPEEYELRLPEKKSEVSPCGSHCSTCPMVKENDCPGCPATTHYKL
ncbi:hypothetical protein EU537_06390 [Candidatus Thorarchaeota archaeon]|nr:MAG: hypothetical protein EU537_06390 [Candidatus Thorarchaeota archaeon]